MNVHVRVNAPQMPAVVVRDCETLPEMADEFFRLLRQGHYLGDACEHLAGRFPGAVRFADDFAIEIAGARFKLQDEMADVPGNSWADIEAKARVLAWWCKVRGIDECEVPLAASLMIDIYSIETDGRFGPSTGGAKAIRALAAVFRLVGAGHEEQRRTGPETAAALMAAVQEARS